MPVKIDVLFATNWGSFFEATEGTAWRSGSACSVHNSFDDKAKTKRKLSKRLCASLFYRSFEEKVKVKALIVILLAAPPPPCRLTVRVASALPSSRSFPSGGCHKTIAV